MTCVQGAVGWPTATPQGVSSLPSSYHPSQDATTTCWELEDDRDTCDSFRIRGSVNRSAVPALKERQSSDFGNFSEATISPANYIGLRGFQHQSDLVLNKSNKRPPLRKASTATSISGTPLLPGLEGFPTFQNIPMDSDAEPEPVTLNVPPSETDLISSSSPLLSMHGSMQERFSFTGTTTQTQVQPSPVPPQMAKQV